MAKGFGKTQSADTAQGRQQNRRVELAIPGEAIDAEIGMTRDRANPRLTRCGAGTLPAGP